MKLPRTFGKSVVKYSAFVDAYCLIAIPEIFYMYNKWLCLLANFGLLCITQVQKIIRKYSRCICSSYLALAYLRNRE